jgi:hypothetical protein
VSALAQAGHQVVVLANGQAVAGKAAQLFPQGAADEERVAGDEVHGADGFEIVVVAEAPQEAGDEVLPGRVEHAAAHQAHAGAREVRQGYFQPVLGQAHVAVDGEQDVAPGGRKSRVLGAGYALVGVKAQDARRGGKVLKPARVEGRARAVVHHNDLVRAHAPGAQSGKQAAHQFGVVVCVSAQGDAGLCHGRLLIASGLIDAVCRNEENANPQPWAGCAAGFAIFCNHATVRPETWGQRHAFS